MVRSQNGPKKVPILSKSPKFCLCSEFWSQVPNSKSCIGAPEYPILVNSFGLGALMSQERKGRKQIYCELFATLPPAFHLLAAASQRADLPQR